MRHKDLFPEVQIHHHKSYIFVGESGTRGPRIPRPDQQVATWRPPAGMISPKREKTKYRERALRAMNSGPRVPEFTDDLRRPSVGKRVLGVMNSGPRAPKSPDDQKS